MISKPEARAALLAKIVLTVPRGFWRSAIAGTAWAYGEALTSTKNDPRFLPTQGRFRAAQERHFLMETSLAKAIGENGGNFAPEFVASNGWSYGLGKIGQFGVMQKKVGDHREPPPGEFRKQVVAANEFHRTGDLFTIDGCHMTGETPVQGVLIHAPKSPRFPDPRFGEPAFTRFAVPFGDYSGWVIDMELSEILAQYPAEERERKGPKPVWKKDVKKGGEGSA